MKITYLFNILLFIIFLSSCAEEKKNEPEQTGRNAFEILKNISSESKEQYLEHFPSIEKIRELGRNEAIIKNQDLRNKLTSMPKEELFKMITEDYKKIKEKGATLEIDWQQITYSDFAYKIISKEGIDTVQGQLYFKSNEKSYNVEVASIWNGTEYMIMKIGDLSE